MLYDKERWEPKAPVVLEPWRQALLDAAEVIRKRGWCQHRSVNIDRHVCLFGAVAVAINRDATDWSGKLFQQVRDALEKKRYNANWNDRPETRKAQVIRALEKTATT